ncbi:MAG TPA: ABC transporter permease [Solirubrobacteraceae bacterium]|jgi:simple sugar transport system permease protein|nr:ABC transporter permease [Solirubrobacteraceae bacterium]
MASATGAPASGHPAPSTDSPASERRTVFGGAIELLRRFLTLREGSIIVVTIIVAIYFAVNTESFFTTGNFKTLLPYFAPFAILAAGEVFLMINGEIDLSIGAVYLFAPFLFYELHNSGVPLLLGVILALIASAGVGVINGFFTAIVGVNSFITTLGTLFAFEGLTLIISHAQPVQTPGAEVTSTTVNVQHVVNGHHIVLPETVNHISTFARIFGGGTYSELIWALAIVAILQVLLSRTRWGLYTVAVGSNRLGASEAGVKVRLVVIRNFILCSTCAGLVGILEAVRATSVQPDTAGANAILLEAISAAVIGGTLLAGGSGTVVGALIGALFLGILHDGLVLQGVNANYLDLYLGLAIILAMVINTYVARVRKGSGLG